MSTNLTLSDFLDRFGSSMPLTHAQHLTGLSKSQLLLIAKEREFVFAEKLLRPRGLEHLPSLPSDSIVHQWAKGTTYTIPANSPGYISVCIHTAAQADDLEEDKK